MVFYGALLTQVINSPGFLLAFGFSHESYVVSFCLFTKLYIYTFDFVLRIGLNYLSRTDEYQADMFAVQKGYGEPLLDSLIRSYADSLDVIWKSHIDVLLSSSHPDLLDRIDAIKLAMEKQPELRSFKRKEIEKIEQIKIEYISEGEEQ